VKEKIDKIIEIIEQADQLFKDCVPREEAQALWDAGIERLAAAIWMHQREDERVDSSSPGST